MCCASGEMAFLFGGHFTNQGIFYTDSFLPKIVEKNWKLGLLAIQFCTSTDKIVFAKA